MVDPIQVVSAQGYFSKNDIQFLQIFQPKRKKYSPIFVAQLPPEWAINTVLCRYRVDLRSQPSGAAGVIDRPLGSPARIITVTTIHHDRT